MKEFENMKTLHQNAHSLSQDSLQKVTLSKTKQNKPIKQQKNETKTLHRYPIRKQKKKKKVLLLTNYSSVLNFLGSNLVPIAMNTSLPPLHTHLSHPWVLGSHQPQGEELWYNRRDWKRLPSFYSHSPHCKLVGSQSNVTWLKFSRKQKFCFNFSHTRHTNVHFYCKMGKVALKTELNSNNQR